MSICDQCNEPGHVTACNKPPYIPASAWQAMTDEQRLEAEEGAESAGYVWTDGAGWIKRETVCKGKAAARALAVLVLTETTAAHLRNVDPKAFEQACDALKPFGWPNRDALFAKLGEPALAPLRPFTVLGVYEEDFQSFADHVMARDADHAFALTIEARPDGWIRTGVVAGHVRVE